MKIFLSGVRRFFTGVRLILPLIPRFGWFALQRVTESTIDYWKASQLTVNDIADYFTDKATKTIVSEYDSAIYWVCYAIASFLYLLGWLVQAWLTVKIFQMLVLAIL